MSRSFRCFTIVAVALLTGCSSTTYWSDWDEEADFSGYSKFSWFERAERKQPTPPPGMSRFVTKRIERSVIAELQGKGFESGPVASSDFLVTYFVGVRDRVTVHHMGFGMPYRGCWGGCGGWGGWGGWGGGSSRVVHYPEGTLVVDVIDTGNRQLVWRGVAQGAFNSPDPDAAKVAKVVTKVLAGFPPVG